MNHMSSGLINMNNDISVIINKFTLKIGRLLQQELINYLDTVKFHRSDIQITYTQNQGLLTSLFFVEIVAKPADYDAIINDIQNWLDKVNA